MNWKRTLPICLVVTAAGCGPTYPPLPQPPGPVEIDDIDLVIGTIPGIDDISAVGFDPTPFVEVFDSVPSSDTELPDLDLSGYDMEMALNDRVQFWIDLFTGRERDNFARYLSRQGIYEDMINERLAARDLPRELLYLALIESGFSPVARSRASAIGLWQFMAATARAEGLEVSEFVDDRRHADRATDAALQHLQRLYDQFGSWYLAAAAYNSGAGRVQRALRRSANSERGHDSLFWRIHSALPAETRNYVPKLIAATVIARNRTRFGFEDVIVLRPASLDTVVVPDATDLEVIAEAAGISREFVVELNPHLYRGVTPPRRQTAVLLPDGRGEPFAIAFAAIPPEKRLRFLEHVVRRGETLSGIASRYGSSVPLLQEANGIRRANQIRVGQRIRIPSAGMRAAPAITRVASSTQSSRAATTYRVRSGDSMWSISRQQGVSLGELLRWNRLTENSIIKPGDRLIVREPGQ
jgi:membrane-bound lytic murein transglycosylase D